MKKLDINGLQPKDKEAGEEEFSIPNEGCCSPEFPEGCILRD